MSPPQKSSLHHEFSEMVANYSSWHFPSIQSMVTLLLHAMWVDIWPACMSVACVQCPWESEEGTDALELESQRVVRHHVGTGNPAQAPRENSRCSSSPPQEWSCLRKLLLLIRSKF